MDNSGISLLINSCNPNTTWLNQALDSAKGFDESQHKLLFKLIIEMKPKGIDFVLSNSDVDLVKTSFVDYFKEIIICKRSINCKNPEAKTNELIISCKPIH